MRSFIKYLFITFFISIATMLYMLCDTTWGLVVDLRYIAQLFPGALKIEKIQGTLFSGFSLQQVNYHTKEETITFQSLEFKWRPKKLLEGKLNINSLVLEKPQITFFSTNTSSANFSLEDIKFLHRISIDSLVIHQLSIQKETLRFDVTGELKDHWNFNWQLHVPKLNVLGANYAGSLVASGSIRGERLVPTIDAVMDGNDLVIAQQKIRKLKGDAHIVVQPKINSIIHLSATQLNIHNNLIKKMALIVTGNIAYENHVLLTEMQILFAKNPAIFVTATLPDFAGLANPKQKIIAAIHFNFTELGDLRYFTPEIQNPRGAIQGMLNIAGTLSEPKITGTLNLKQGHVVIPALGISLDDILLQATLDQSKNISLQGSVRSGEGRGQLQGNIDLNKSDFPVTLTLQGSNLNAVSLPQYKIIVSPDVKLNFIYPNLELQGKIRVTHAIVKLKNFISTASLPDETVFVGETRTETPSILLALKLHLAVDLEHDIFFSYKDFETHLGGQLLIDQMPGNPATATGEIHSEEGKYTLYGQKLVIKTGRLIFAGNVLTNPSVQIEAIRNIKGQMSASALMPSLENDTGADTTVGLRITGTANSPKMTLFSIPAGLTQAQILSSLGAEGAALMGALSALNPGASNFGGMTDKLTKMLGLTEMNISSVETFNTTTNQMQATPSFVVGKQISKKLSLHYSVGIFNPVSVLNVRYQLNKSWAIQSETSTIDNGADILYVFERP